MTSNRKRNFIFTLLGIIFLVGTAYVLSNLEDWKEDYKKAKIYKAEKEKFISLCLGTKNYDNQPSALFIRVMDCVHRNSVHKMDERFKALFKEGRHAYLNRINSSLSSTKKNTEKPHMECSTRSKTMSDILRYLGYDAYSVALTEPKDNFPDHVIVNVHNPITQKDEIYDPTHNMYIKDMRNNELQGIENILTLPAESILFCSPENGCEKSLISPEGTFQTGRLPEYHGIAYLRVYEDRKGPLLYNPDRFDPDKIRDVWGEQKSYCAVHPDHCEKRQMVKSPSL